MIKEEIMNKDQREKGKILYTIYILIAALYVLIKIAFVLAGYLHPGAILHGLIPSVITMAVGFLAIVELKKSKGLFWNKLMIFLPVLIFVITPIYMFFKQKSEWLTEGRLEVLIIYELMAVAQFLIALKQLKNIHK